MNSADLVTMGVRNLLRRKARTVLTVLGVVIGTASIVVMLSLGIAMNINFENQLSSMGSLNSIDVSSNQFSYDEKPNPNKKIASLDDKNLALIEQIPHVSVVMPIMQKNIQFSTGRYVMNATVNGVDFNKFSDFNFTIEKGALPEGSMRYPVIFGFSSGSNFYNPKARGGSAPPEIDVMKARLTAYPDTMDPNKKPKGVKVSSAGVLKQSNDEKDWSVYMSVLDLEKLSTELKRQAKSTDNNTKSNSGNNNQSKDKYTTFKVKVDDMNEVQNVQNQIKEMGFQAWSLSDILDSMKKTSAGLRAILGGIGAVSLFVAALGITNTMVMSIYERTREIGVMKVLGAELKDIKRLFLFEAGMIGFFGGVFGIAISYLISFALNSAGVDLLGGGTGMSQEGVKTAMSVIPLWLSGSALAFGTVVGLVSGYYPALRAMKLSALEAIRNE